MSTKEVFLTREGYEKLNKELDYLKTVRRRDMSKQLEEARAQGDLSENYQFKSIFYSRYDKKSSIFHIVLK